MKAVILAGGKGTRLAPYTTIFPKPLMPLGEKPILEIVIRQLKLCGFTEIILAVGYLSELIKAYFHDGRSLGIKISYSKESKALGTAGPLSLIEGLNETFLVMNGDILTTIPYLKLVKYHIAKKGIATIAVHRRMLDVDFGVITVGKGNNISSYLEKPKLHYDVSMGIYVFDPGVLKYIFRNKQLDFPDLINKLLRAKEKVCAYISNDHWLDIGRHDDYETAQKEFRKIEKKLI
ncbi:MAG: sugar phosphate nucleotidyltransferase [Candidatus Omnitrophica bacterium]|nr:sugar phosphate nucleotidyltransferase [Candidatus Omnitrophota bacterium]